MRRLIPILLTLTVATATVAVAGEFEDALEIYRQGDYSTAMAKLQPLADTGDGRAEYAIGRMYHFGQGVDEDNDKAAYWFHRAADHGQIDAQYLLGVMYATGTGVENDDDQARRWFRVAAERGDPRAEFGLGSLMMRDAQPDATDLNEAVTWIRKAAEQGWPDAQYVLGGLFAQGRIVEQSCVKGTFWNALAAKQGHERAVDALDRCKDHMTDEQKAEAEKMIESFKPVAPDTPPDKVDD